MGRSIPEELRGMAGRYRSAFLLVGLLSAILNILLLGGSVYMMLVYDSVLPSHSLPTLFGLFAILLGVYAFQGVFETMRGRILTDMAGAFDHALGGRVQQAMADHAISRKRDADGQLLLPMRDLENIRAFLAGPGPATIIDLPWMIFFIGVLMLLHPWIGVTALMGAAVLLGLAFLTDRMLAVPAAALSTLSARRTARAADNVRHAELIAVMGMRRRRMAGWAEINAAYLSAQRRVSVVVGALGGVSRIGRLVLQSLILTVGALLVIRGEASGGVIFAASILSSRALAPVDQAIAQWRSLAAARLGWRRLCAFLDAVPARGAVRTVLPLPCRDIRVEQLALGPPGAGIATLQAVGFTLKAGDGLAVVGASAAGKSTLGRGLVGAWHPLRGTIRLDGATGDQWDAERLGRAIGYLPQRVELLEGTVAENIARFDPDAPSEAIVAAAQAAGVHEMIVGLDKGYDTPVGADGAFLSGGQQQRIALARALYGDPFLLVLDEPDANLDGAGEEALERAVRAARLRGAIVVLISHRVSLLSCASHALFLRDGRAEAFGPRDEVLKRLRARPAASGEETRDKAAEPAAATFRATAGRQG